MIAEIKKTELEKAVKSAVKCLDRKSVIPVLNSIRLTFELGTLTVCGTNLDQTLQMTIEASKVKDDLDICVDGNLFANLIGHLEGDTVKLGYVEKTGNLIVERPSGGIKIRSVSADQFPELPQADKIANFITFKTYDLKNTFKAILCGTKEDAAISSSVANIAKFAVETNLVESKFTCCSTDKTRLAIVKGLCEKSDETDKSLLEFNFPVYAIRLLLPTLQAFEKEFETVNFGEDKNHIFVKFGEDCSYTFRKMTGDFPDLTKFLNSLNFVSDINLQRDEFLSSIETVALFADDRSRSIKFDVTDGGLTLTACDADRGEIEETLDIGAQTEEFQTAYDALFLMPVLRQSEGNLTLSFAKNPIYNQKGELIEHVYPMRVSPTPNGVSVDFYIQSMRF